MRMKTMFNKRRFLAALSAVLLISAALVASCTNPLDGYSDKQDNNSVEAPAGKGLVRINITDPNAKSILPSLPAVGTMYYSVQFVGTATTTIGASTALTYSALNNVPIALDADTYAITITAWKEAAKTNALAGWTGSATVSSGTPTTVSANLEGWTTSGTGTFTYTITVPALPTTTTTAWTITTPPTSYTTCEMEVRNASNALVGSVIDLSTPANRTGSIPSISSGYYTVKITLSAANCQNRVVGPIDMLIFNTLTSDYSYSVPALNQNEFSVAFNLNGKNDDDGTCTTTTQSGISNAGTVSNPGNPGDNGYDFVGWHDNAAGSGTAWTFGSSGTKVFKDTTLYAQWTPKTATTINIAAIDGVTAPVTGATPVTAVTATAQYTGTVAWSGNPTTFAGGTAYTATITLTPKSGYTLTGVTADFFTVSGASPVNNSADSGVITAVFPATDTTINIAAIGGVTAPATGGTPVTAITTTAQYTGTVAWKRTSDDDPLTGNFAASTEYTATITLTPTTGFTLTGVAADFFTVSGATATNSANSGVITAVFPATAATTISIAAISGVVAPTAGVVPVSAITETAQYTGTVAWSGSPAIFAETTAYTATITLTPKTGYTLTGVAANFFTVSGASPVNNSADSGVITAVFPTTGTVSNGAALNITFTLTDASISPTVPSSISYSDILDGSKTITFALQGGTYTGVTWTLDGVTATSGNSDTGLTINATSNLLPYLVSGTHVLNVRGLKGGVSYSASTEFTISN